MNLDLEGAFRGRLPWSVGGWREANEWYHRLQQTPKDDWDLEELGLTGDQLDAVPAELLPLVQELIDKGLLRGPRNDSPLAVRGNAFHPWHQLARFLMGRYPVDVWFFHFHRFMVIGDFLMDHRGDLKRDGLMRDTEEEYDEIRQETVETLCVLPFSETYYIDGEERYTFDYDEVVAEARRLTDEARGQEQGGAS